MGPHWFDMMRYIAGEVKSVMARTAVIEPERLTRDAEGTVRERIQCDADDTFFANFETESGVNGAIYGSWAGHGEPTMVGEGAVFYGQRGRVTGDRLVVDGEEPQSLSALHQPDLPFGLEDDFALAQWDWLEAIRSGIQPETSGEEGLRDLACAYAVVESAKAKREVSVAEVLDGSLADYQSPIDRHFGIE